MLKATIQKACLKNFMETCEIRNGWQMSLNRVIETNPAMEAKIALIDRQKNKQMKAFYSFKMVT